MQALLIFLLSTVKLGFGGIPAAVLAKFHFLKAVSITSAGGITGSVVFAYQSKRVLNLWNRFRLKFFPHHKPGEYMYGKLAHKIHTKLGLPGLAFLSPFILSIPIGTILAVHLHGNKLRVLSFMIVSITFWDIVLYYLYISFYHTSIAYLAHIH
jgi:hypothetical protein